MGSNENYSRRLEDSFEEMAKVVGEARAQAVMSTWGYNEGMRNVGRADALRASEKQKALEELRKPDTTGKIQAEYNQIKKEKAKKAYTNTRNKYVSLFDKLNNPEGRNSYFNYPSNPRLTTFGVKKKIKGTRNAEYGTPYTAFAEAFGPNSGSFTNASLNAKPWQNIDSKVSTMNQVGEEFIAAIDSKKYNRLHRAATTGLNSKGNEIKSATPPRQGGGRRKTRHRRKRMHRRRHTRGFRSS